MTVVVKWLAEIVPVQSCKKDCSKLKTEINEKYSFNQEKYNDGSNFRNYMMELKNPYKSIKIDL